MCAWLHTQAEGLLNSTEISLNNSRDILENISERLVALEQQIEWNKIELDEATNLTRIAQGLANQVENVSKLQSQYKLW